MRALITGASSGIGRELARALGNMGYDLVLVARSRSLLEELARECPTDTEIHVLDLSQAEACYQLHEQVSKTRLDILINNAGFGYFGEFAKTDLATELNLIDLNVRAVHILTKLFLQDFVRENHGIIMNVASIAGFLSGPLLSSYYASKAYVLRLTEAIYEEQRRAGSKVRICALCPGPVKTGFNRRAGASFKADGLDSVVVAAYALKKMFRGRLIIIPGWPIKLMHVLIRFASDRALLSLAYTVQSMKGKPSQ